MRKNSIHLARKEGREKERRYAKERYARNNGWERQRPKKTGNNRSLYIIYYERMEGRGEGKKVERANKKEISNCYPQGYPPQ